MVARVDTHIRLRRARSAAEAASRAKSEFLAKMNHELRTPMNAVLGYASLLQETEREPQNRRFLEAIQGAGRTLMKLIDDVLDLSRIESGHLELESRPTNLRALLLEMERLFASKAQKKGLGLEVHWSSELPPVLLLDDIRLRQILLNLVGNALKFTREGQVTVAVNVLPGESHSVFLEIAVRDSGIGIPQDQQQRIFDSFTQQDGQSHAEYGGTGLGLAICRQLASLMGGVIRLTSAPGIGSTFSLHLPHVSIVAEDIQESPAEVRKAKRLQFAPATLLVADDDLMSRRLLVDILSRQGFALLQAEDGEQAVEMALAKRPDLILMDLNMAEMRGDEAARRIADSGQTAHIPILAVTASVANMRRPGLDPVFAGWLGKPITKDGLLEKLAEYLPLKREGGDGAEPEPAAAEAPVVVTEAIQQVWKALPPHPSINELESLCDSLAGADDGAIRTLGEGLRRAAEGFDPDAIEDALVQLRIRLSPVGSERHKDDPALPSATHLG